MTLAVYSNPRSPTKRRPTAGTSHRGWPWVAAVHCLKAAAQNAHSHADPSPISADQVGGEIIDHINDLDNQSLRVLRVTLGILVRWSRD
jgi:hypothetical protein